MTTFSDPPSWKQPSRPCPFYAQGRCLFADSCNFLHTITVKTPDSPVLLPSEAAFDSLTNSPDSSRRRAVRLRSPPRSPRLSSLLQALGDAIVQDEGGEPELELDEEEDTIIPVVHVQDDSESESEDLTVMQADYQSAQTLLAPALPNAVPNSPASFFRASGVLEELKRTYHRLEAEVESIHDDDPPEDAASAEVNAICSGAVATSLPPPSPVTDFPTRSRPRPPASRRRPPAAGPARPQAVGSPPHAPQTPPPASEFPRPQTPPSPSYSEHPTEGLLSPLDVPLAAPPLSFCPPMRDAAELQREDSIDSGYADTWVGPAPFVASPPRDARRVSTLSLLSSPFGSPSSRLSLLPQPPAATGVGAIGLGMPPVSPTTPLFSPRFAAVASEHARSTYSSDLDSDVPLSQDEGFDEEVSLEAYADAPSQFDSADTDEEGEETVRQLLNPHSPESAGLAYAEEAPEGDDVPAFLLSPPPGDETVQDVYDGYYESDAQPSPQPLSLAAAAVEVAASLGYRPEMEAGPSTVRSRVFSPPSPQQIHGRATRSPAHSSVRSASRESLTEADKVEQWEQRATTKVPFGFRGTSQKDRSASPASTSGTRTVRRRPPSLVVVGSTSREPLDPSLLSPEQPASSGSRQLKPLRLSMILNSASSLGSFPSSIPALTSATTAHTPSSPTASSEFSLSNSNLLSYRRSSLIPSQSSKSPSPSIADPSSATVFDTQFPHRSSLHRSVSTSASTAKRTSVRRSSTRYSSSRRFSLLDKFQRSESRASEPAVLYEADEDMVDEYGASSSFDGPRASSSLEDATSSSRHRLSIVHSPIVHAIATPKPTLLFALASDNPEEVRKVLESGEAGPNDNVGPQSALAFTLTNNQLHRKVEMVKLLLAYGADPRAIKEISAVRAQNESRAATPEAEEAAVVDVMDQLDPATRYYIARADAPQTRRTSALIHRSAFRPLAKVRYDLVGQDRAIEQLFRALSMPSMAPIVVLLCGPSGHGKSLLARKFGSLLGVPTHTVNMTTLRSTHDIWRSHSMSPYEAPSDCTLAEFLINNEGKRCVVVLDEIEKVEDPRYLSSLLMPWEIGRCSFDASQRHIDVSKVVWLGTSNVGHDLVFEHQEDRAEPDTQMSREEYVDLMAMFRPQVSQRLGPSLSSRITTVLPFVPFTPEEKMAIAAEAIYALAGEAAADVPPATVEMVVRKALESYMPVEGARSLYRAVSTLLLDTL